MARQASTASCAVKALVEATPISGPATVSTAPSLSRAMELSGTFTTDEHPLPAVRAAAASPPWCRRSRRDWLTRMAPPPSASGGSR